jgi:hypothetical protein
MGGGRVAPGAHGGRRSCLSRGGPGHGAAEEPVVHGRGEAVKIGEAEADGWGPATVLGLNPVN